MLRLMCISPLFHRFSCKKTVGAALNLCQKRLKNKLASRKKQEHKDKALSHFDDFYKAVYGKDWPSIRIALLCPQKYCAVINNYEETDRAVEKLTELGCVDVGNEFRQYVAQYKEEKASEKREKDLKRIFEMDRKMKSVHEQQEEAEAKQIYEGKPKPEGLLRSPNDDQNRIVKLAKDGDGFETTGALHSFIPATKLKGLGDWISQSEYYGYYKTESELKVIIEKEEELSFPPNLKVFAFERGNISSFPQPRRGPLDNLDYYLMDASSLLPILALDLRLGNTVLDLCAAPGGKSLVMLQTLLPGQLIANDVQESRVNRIHNVLKQYFSAVKITDIVSVTERNGCHLDKESVFDKVLVDVPCTTDRHSVNESDNNIFRPTRINERLRLPQLQTDLLSGAIRAVKPGGTVIYSTCTLSPVQNDGVVYMALKKVWEESNIEVVVKDMSSVLQPLQFLFKFGHRENMGLRYGQLVIPTLPNNFGPMYFCKITRMK